jgi:Holliday junction resolvasome RuvABC DNA-binding subunit
MTEWHTISSRFSPEEKKILDTLQQVYGLNYNQSLKTGVEILGRMIVAAELYATSDSKILKKIIKISKKYNRLMNSEVKQALKEFPKEQQETEYEKLSANRDRVFSHFDNVFVKNRKQGRKKLPRKKGRPSTRL